MDIKSLEITNIELSVRSQNALSKAGVRTVGDMLKYNEEKLKAVKNLGAKSITEILEKIEQYKRIEMKNATSSDEKVKTIFDILYLAKYRKEILTYVRANDIDIKNMGISNRPKNQLAKNNFHNLSHIIFMNRQDLLKIPAMGLSSADEIMDKVYIYLREHEASMLAYINGDENAALSDDFISKKVMDLYRGKGFQGLSYSDIKAQLDLPIELEDSRLKTVIGRLISKNELSYVDYRCYPVYLSVEDFLKESLSVKDRNKDIIQKRLDGMILEAIGMEYEVSKQRVDQIIVKDLRKLKEEYASKTGKMFFDEDYYKYFYETYEFDKKECSKWLGVSENVWNYLEACGIEQGINDMELALEDLQLDAGFKLRIKSYLNKDSIYIDGEWVRLRRADLELALCKKYCQEDRNFDEFVDLYNNFLQEAGLEYSEDIYITESTYRTRINMLSGYRFTLWKLNSVMRYYEIDSKDYTELIDTLGLKEYQNIEISTLKFVNNYPELMKEYDIRDQYELHNLLRKIIPDGSFHDFHCERMPDIRFGEFDRDKAIFELIKNNSPISTEDLCSLIKDEYGYEAGVTASTYLRPFAKYYHQGIYSVEQTIMPMDKMEMLQSHLTEDFYFVDEVEEIYSKLFSNGNLNEINSYNIKSMGFNIYSNYILKNHLSADEYFEYILTKDEIVDISNSKKKYASVQVYYGKLMELKHTLQIIEFEPEQFISFKRLEKFGVTMDDVRSYVDEVYNYLDDGEYFTIYSLKQSGFVSPLFELGFSDLFYASLFLADDRIAFRKMFGTAVMRKSTENVTKESFAIDRIQYHQIIDTYDFLNELNDDYGCHVEDKWDVIPLLQNTSIYYDKILDRLYANKELYYKEIDMM